MVRFNKKLLATTFTLSGTMMGAGILGLPFVFAKAGFLAGTLWLIILSIIIVFVNLSLAEVTLRLKGKHQLTGYARKYLGPTAEKVMFFGMAFGVYSALLAYLVGEGESLSKLLPGTISPFLLGVLFWATMTLLLREGLKGLKKVETYGVFIIIALIVGIFINFLPEINTYNLTRFNGDHFTFPFGVILFALLGFTSIPELRQEIKGQEKHFKKAIIIGTLLPSILYLIFCAVFVGILGQDVNQVATLSFGPVITLLGIFTMLTSFFVLTFSLKDTYKYDLGFSDEVNFSLSSVFPLLVYAFVYLFDFANFSTILGMGGVISGGVTGIMILLISKKAKENQEKNKNTKQPQICMPLTWGIILVIALVFIAGVILEISKLI